VRADNEVAADNETVYDSASDAATISSGIIIMEALQEFLDTFMKRPAVKLAEVQIPEGGLI